MPTEDDLRALFSNEDAPKHTIDAGRVIRASRARRLPKQLAAGGAGALVVLGATVIGVQALLPQQNAADTATAPMMQEDADQQGGASDSEISMKRLPADEINQCGAAPMDVAPSQFGLVLDVVFPSTASAASERIDGTVIMTNTSAEPVTGSTLLNPAMTLSQDGVVVWHTNGPTDLVDTMVDLAPGASMEYPASFTPVRCSPDDEQLEAFPDDLPLAGPGTYDLSAALDFNPTIPTATTELDLVTGPAMPITLE